MSNKTQLQENNVKLNSIKSTIEELPEINAWKGQTSIVPGTQAITIPAYTDTALIVQGDTNLIASNIAKGVPIFGVTGTAPTSLGDFGITQGSFTVDSDLGTVSINIGMANYRIITIYATQYEQPTTDYSYPEVRSLTVYAHSIPTNTYWNCVIASSGWSRWSGGSDTTASLSGTTVTITPGKCIQYGEARRSEAVFKGTYGWIAIA